MCKSQKRKLFKKRGGWSLMPNVRVQRKIKPGGKIIHRQKRYRHFQYLTSKTSEQNVETGD